MARTAPSCRLRVARLEERTVPAGGTVFVHAFVDANLNGQYDSSGHAGETLIPGIPVFADLNLNGQLDAGEPSDVTSTQFTFDADGTYLIHCDPLPGAARTTPDALPVVLQGGNLASLFFGFDVTQNSAGAQELFAVGADAGGAPHVRVLNADGTLRFDLLAYDANFRGGVRVATADITLDGIEDIVTAAGAGGGPHVKVFDGRTGGLVREWMAYDPAFSGGVFVGAWRGRHAPRGVIVTGPGAGGGPHVRAFDGTTGEAYRDIIAYDPSFRGGVTVAVNDLNFDSTFPEIITGAGPGGGPHVKVFDGQTNQETESFFAYEADFRGGVFVASLDTNGDSRADIVTGAGAGGGPLVKSFDWFADKMLFSTYAYDPAFRGGVRVGATIGPHQQWESIAVAPGAGGGPHVRALATPSLQEWQSFYAFDPAFMGGVFVG